MRLVLASLALGIACASLAEAQGFYENQVRRNPTTGELEVVGNDSVYRHGVTGHGTGSYRDGRSFHGSRFNPYTGTATQSQVQRNPFTGRVDVANESYNPWTGARVQTLTRFNPFTRRYETTYRVVPPTRLPAADVEEPAEVKPRRERPRPKVIETPKEGSPALPPPPVEGAGSF